MTKERSPLTGEGLRAHNNIKQPDSNSLPAQRQRILNHLLANGTLTTVYARRFLDCMHVAGRVMELKRQGYQIQTHWINDITEAGKSHRVARYLLVVRPE